MSRGDLRNSIVNQCKDDFPEFEERLVNFINEVELKVGEIRDNLDINDISDLGKIEDAKSLAEELADELY